MLGRRTVADVPAQPLSRHAILVRRLQARDVPTVSALADSQLGPGYVGVRSLIHDGGRVAVVAVVGGAVVGLPLPTR